jgi:Glutamine cyclotransferase
VNIANLNELEFVEGKLWANIYYDNRIAIIDPETGFIEK